MGTNYIFYKLHDKLKALPVFLTRLFKAAGGLCELMLFIRLFLKFTAANPGAPVVGLLYGLSDGFVAPFSPIFVDISIFGRVIEIPVVSAMLGYVVLMWVISKIWHLFMKPYHK